MRINGIGTTFLGVSDMDKNDVATATLWFTFLFFPVIPLRRYRVQFLPSTGSGYAYQILGEEAHSLPEILKTYISGWLLAPLLIFGPMVLAIRENWEALKLPESVYTPYIFFSIAWFVVTFLVVTTRLENRCKPPKAKTKAEEPAPTAIASVEEPQESTDPQKPASPWGGIAFVLVLVGSVAGALYMVIAQVGPAAWLIEIQERWFGGYYMMYTFLIVWVVLVLGLALIAGLIGSAVEALKGLVQKMRR
jgi:hypothetical protein